MMLRSNVVPLYMRTWFVPDLISSIPIGMIMRLANSNLSSGNEPSEGDGGTVARANRMLKLLRIFKITRMLRLLHASLLEQITYHVRRLFEDVLKVDCTPEKAHLSTEAVNLAYPCL